MEHNIKVVPPELVMDELLALMDEVDCVPLVISGGSMTPFLAHGRDTVYLSRVDRSLKRGDMVLYQRAGGAYVLHRIFRVEDDSYTLVGDAQTRLEQGVRPEQIRALVTAVRRKGRLLQKGSPCWDFFEKVWIRMLPLRPAARRLCVLVKKLRG